MSKRKILITGGLGFIGSHMIVQLLSLGEKVYAIDNCINSNEITKSYISKIAKSDFSFKKLNISDEALAKYIEINEIDTLIHLAGLKSVSESVRVPAKYYHNNVLGSKHLFMLAKKYKIKNLIFSSSATVYGKPIYLPIDENHQIRSTNPYAQNKIDIENILIEDQYFQNKCSVKILRYFNPIGAHPSGLIGENPKGEPNNLMPYILKVAKKIYPYIKIFGNDYRTKDGTGVRDFIHIMDLVEAHIQALEYKKNGISIFNIGTGFGNSVLDLINIFEKTNKIKIPFIFKDRRPGDVPLVFANSLKAEIELNFRAKKNLEEMCRDAWKYAQNNY